MPPDALPWQIMQCTACACGTDFQAHSSATVAVLDTSVMCLLQLMAEAHKAAYEAKMLLMQLFQP